MILFGEIVMFFDIVVNFLLAFSDSEGMNYIKDFKKIRNRYIFEGRFFRDLIVWMPFQFGLASISPALIVFQIIKIVRLEMLLKFMEKKTVMPLIRNYFD